MHESLVADQKSQYEKNRNHSTNFTFGRQASDYHTSTALQNRDFEKNVQAVDLYSNQTLPLKNGVNFKIGYD